MSEATYCSRTGSDGFRGYEHRTDEYCPVCVPKGGVPDVTEPTYSYDPVIGAMADAYRENLHENVEGMVRRVLRAALDQVSDEFPQDALNTLAEAASDD